MLKLCGINTATSSFSHILSIFSFVIKPIFFISIFGVVAFIHTRTGLLNDTFLSINADVRSLKDEYTKFIPGIRRITISSILYSDFIIIFLVK